MVEINSNIFYSVGESANLQMQHKSIMVLEMILMKLLFHVFDLSNHLLSLYIFFNNCTFLLKEFHFRISLEILEYQAVSKAYSVKRSARSMAEQCFIYTANMVQQSAGKVQVNPTDDLFRTCKLQVIHADIASNTRNMCG